MSPGRWPGVTWQCIISNGRDVTRYFIYILRSLSSPECVWSVVKPDNCPGNTFLLRLKVGKLALWHQVGCGR